jgi:hypothetical protein
MGVGRDILLFVSYAVFFFPHNFILREAHSFDGLAEQAGPEKLVPNFQPAHFFVPNLCNSI